MATTSPPQLYMVIVNIQKLANVKALMMTAAAFGCTGVVIVGQTNNSERQHFLPTAFQQAMDQGRIKLHGPFSKWSECLEFFKEESIYLLGVEIDEESHLLHDDYEPPSCDKIAILMGNEGQGIHPKHLESCQSLIRIPQYGQGTASLNVNVAASIVMHHLHQWKRKKLMEGLR